MAGLVSLISDTLSASDVERCPTYTIKQVALDQSGSVILDLTSDIQSKPKKLKLNKLNLQRLLQNYNLEAGSLDLVGKAVSLYLTDLDVKGTRYKNVIRVKYDITALLANN